MNRPNLIQILTYIALLILTSVANTSICSAQPYGGKWLQHSDLNQWLQSDECKKYSAQRLKLDVSELQQTINSTKPQGKSKEAKAEFKSKIETMKAELALLKKAKDKLYLPLVSIEPSLTDHQGAVGEIATYGRRNFVTIFQVIGKNSVILSYPDSDATYSFGKGFGNRPKSSYVWLEGYAADMMPEGESVTLNSVVHVKVDGYKDYKNSLGESVHVPLLTLIDLSKELASSATSTGDQVKNHGGRSSDRK